MATLYLDDLTAPQPSLREWLDGDWGLLISCPSDFEDQSLERDRWLEVMQAAFAASGVRPLALRHDGGDLDQGWVGMLLGDKRRVGLAPLAASDVATRRLRRQILGIQEQRFVVIVDSRLHARAVVTYRRDAYSVRMSPLDLLARVNAARQSWADAASAPEVWPATPSTLAVHRSMTPFTATVQ